MKIYITFEMDRSGQPYTCGNKHTPPPLYCRQSMAAALPPVLIASPPSTAPLFSDGGNLYRDNQHT
jgi:hypothetical protein